MSDLKSAQVLPAGKYKIELWGPMHSGVTVEIHADAFVLGHSIETVNVPVMVPRDGASHGRLVQTSKRQFSILVAVPQEPD